MPWFKLGPVWGGLQAQAGQLGAQFVTATGDMASRNVAVTVIRKGKEVLEGILQRTQKQQPKFGKSQGVSAKEEPLKNFQNFQSGNKTPTLLRSTWLKYLNQSNQQNLAKEIQKTAVRNFQSGSAALFGRAVGVGGRRISQFALIGFALSNNAMKSSSQDFSCDKICDEIKTMFQSSKASQWSAQPGNNLEDYDFGQLIAKGCNAAVYEARIKKSFPEANSYSSKEEEDSIQIIPEEGETENSALSDDGFDMVSDLDVASFSTGSDITIITDSDKSGITFDKDGPLSTLPITTIDSDFDLAVKMMFNYDAESQAATILKSMKNEALPAKMADSFCQMMEWENGNHPKKRLKQHPNIVDMQAVFVDEVQLFPKCLSEFPHALPARLNPDGFGRNKTMYLVMKRYNCTLRDYLHQQTPTLHESVMLLAQLMEAVVHLGQESVAHRDIKSDNILLDTDHFVPHLVLSDFGSCLSDDQYGNLKVPYFTDETCKGGNRSLMAPEVVCKSPGYRVYLDYSQSDVWACGAIAYEIFGVCNPFYRNKDRVRLDSCGYREQDLPDLPDHVPTVLQELVKAMLRRDPAQRPDAVTVANILHLWLWGPPEWTMALTSGSHPPCKVQIMRWILTLSAGAMCQRAMQRSSFIDADPSIDMQLKSVFLSRLDISDFETAIQFTWKLPIISSH